MGRPPKPTALKLLDGTFRADRANLDEPILPPAEIRRAPPHLTKFSKLLWKRLAPLLSRMRILTDTDYDALELLCETREDYDSARREIREHGHTTEEPIVAKGVEVGAKILVRPEVKIMADNARLLVTLYDRLGMTPSGRARVAGTGMPKRGLSSGSRKRESSIG